MNEQEHKKPEEHKRVIWSGEHKNATRAVVTRYADSYGPMFKVEMWQRPRFGIAYTQAHDRSLKWAFGAAGAAMRFKLKEKQ